MLDYVSNVNKLLESGLLDTDATAVVETLTAEQRDILMFNLRQELLSELSDVFDEDLPEVVDEQIIKDLVNDYINLEFYSIIE